MGLAASQSRFLFLTARKADCELGLAIGSNRKMAISREMSELTRLYNSKLESKQITFRNGSEYQKINYQYLMGYGARYTAFTNNKCPIKKEGDYNTVLTDYNGRVVIANDYVKYFAMAGLKPDAQGRGQGFGEDKIAELILIISNGGIMPDNLETTSTEVTNPTNPSNTTTPTNSSTPPSNPLYNEKCRDAYASGKFPNMSQIAQNSEWTLGEAVTDALNRCRENNIGDTSLSGIEYLKNLQNFERNDLNSILMAYIGRPVAVVHYILDAIYNIAPAIDYATYLNPSAASATTPGSSQPEQPAETQSETTTKTTESDIDRIIKIHNGGEIESNFAATVVNTRSGNITGTKTVDNSANATAVLKQIIDFYWPIFQAAATNGWTTEYNQDMAHNEDFISDALVSGTFCLADVNESGGYDPDDSLSYFCANGVITARNDSEVRAKVQAWYDSEKANINAKETMLDLEISDLSTELEAIKTEMQSVKSIIEDAENVFDWGKA